jgi:hypothetical protein
VSGDGDAPETAVSGRDAAPETAVPDDAAAATCPYCGRRFPRERAVTLHVGLDHADEASDEEVESFQAAYRDERDDLRRFQLLALAVLIVVYFGFLFAFAIVG